MAVARLRGGHVVGEARVARSKGRGLSRFLEEGRPVLPPVRLDGLVLELEAARPVVGRLAASRGTEQDPENQTRSQHAAGESQGRLRRIRLLLRSPGPGVSGPSPPSGNPAPPGGVFFVRSLPEGIGRRQGEPARGSPESCRRRGP
jgi:hypothetical protein